MKTYKIMVTGRVQGVGFRSHIQQGAKKQALNGTVRNLDDGRVEIILQGSESDLTEMKQLLQTRAHPFMKVTQVDIEELSSQNEYHSFDIIY